MNMTIRSKQDPWAAFFFRDDRQLLKEFSSLDWSSQKIIEKIPGTVFSALRALHFSRSNRWGVAVSVEKMRPIGLQFLEWMRTNGEWSQCETNWRKKGKGPWSMPYQIFRSYYRFRRAQFPKGVKNEVSYSGQRSLLELEGSLEHMLAGKVLEAFSSVTFSLPENLQLPYQLHLEGLLPDEMSRILEVPVKQVEAWINEAKTILGSGYTKLRETA